MTPGQSIVAFYGDAALANEHLGKGVFVDYIPLNTPQGQQLLQAHALYAPNNHPDNAKAFVRVEHFQEAQPGEDLASLNGIIEASGLPLTLANIPDGPARSQVYYRHPSNGGVAS
jgi:hypothetical protein